MSGRFYTYLYRDPRPGKDGAPIWVGKGRGRRMYAHLRKSHNRILERIIVKCRKVALEPIVERFAYVKDEQSAHAAERFLIALVGRRDLGTGTLCNLTDGGEGASGCVASAETRAKRGAAFRGRRLGPRSPEHCANISAALRGRSLSQEHCKKISDGQRGRKRGPLSPEVRTKISANNGSRRPEVQAKISANNGARKLEVRAKLSAAAQGNKRCLGRKVSDETRAKIGMANRGRRLGPRSPEYCAKMSKSQRLRRAAEKIAHDHDFKNVVQGGQN